MKKNYRWLLLIAISAIVFIINVDYTAVNLALLVIAQKLHASLTTIQWVLSGYVLAWSVTILPAGSFTDGFSKKYMCLGGLILFLFASLLAGIATSVNILILARIIQGAAGAIYTPAIFALINLNFEKEEQGKAVGIMSLGIGLGLAMGPFIGGILVTWLSWRSIFFVNIPIGIIVLYIIYKYQSPNELIKAKININKVSVVLFIGCLSSLLYILSQWQNWPQQAALYSTIFILAIFGIGIFIYLQTKIAEPLVPLQLFANDQFSGCCLSIFLQQYAFSSILILTGFYLEKFLQFSVLKSSIIYLFLTVIFGFISLIGGAWIDRAGLKKPALLGFLLMAIGLLIFMTLPMVHNIWTICLIFSLLGVGMALAFTTLNTGAVKTVAHEKMGVASSVFIMLSCLGNACAVTLTTLLYQILNANKYKELLRANHIPLGYEQIQQLKLYYTNIAMQKTHSLNSSTQDLMLQYMNQAINYNIHYLMLINIFICIVAMCICAKLLK